MSGVLGDTVREPPQDGISRLRFASKSDSLLASSWDQTLRVYNGRSLALRASTSHASPLLDCCFHQDDTAVAGCLDGSIVRVDLNTQQQSRVGTHADAGVRCVEHLQEVGLLASAGWDGTLRLWDFRAPQDSNCVRTVRLPGKAFTMSAAMDKLVVGCSGRHVWVFNVHRAALGEVEQQRESTLRYQTRCLAVMPDGRGYALGSVEGRVAMEYFDLSPAAQAAKYAFKCHRRAEGGKDVVFPVHGIAFHPLLGTFATGGGDGVVSVWDGDNKKRLFQVLRYPTSVASLALSRDGSMLAVASSYTYERGQEGSAAQPPDAIYVRPVLEAEVMPKNRRPPAAA